MPRSKFRFAPFEVENVDPNMRRNRSNSIGYKFTRARQKAFLEAVAETGNLSEACRAVNITPSTYAYHREKYPDFAEALAFAKTKGLALLEEEMRRRGVKGWKEEVFQKGELVGYVTKYSDNLLLAQARAQAPDLYSNQMQPGGGNITVHIIQAFEKLPDGSVAPVVMEGQPVQIEHTSQERKNLDAP